MSRVLELELIWNDLAQYYLKKSKKQGEGKTLVASDPTLTKYLSPVQRD